MTDDGHSLFLNEEYTVGWICALLVEFAAARGMLDEPQIAPSKADSNSYVLGSIGKFNVGIVCLSLDQLGAASAAMCAKELLFTFPKIHVGLLVGIGTGIPSVDDDPYIHLGDIVISSSKENGGVVLCDFEEQLEDGSFQCLSILNRPPRALGSALPKLQARHMMEDSQIMDFLDHMLQKYPGMRKRGYGYPGLSSDRLFVSTYPHAGGRDCGRCQKSQQVDRDVRQDVGPKIHYGTIASGSSVIKDPISRDRIRDKHGAICLEMEAAGLTNDFPCLVIRGISDYADSLKNDSWQQHMRKNS